VIGRKLIAVVGPTATGKTALAVELALRLGGEIVGADSRQVYRRMDIGTAKPTEGQQAAVRHHVIDVVDPDGAFSLARWLDLARAALDDIWSRGRQPFLVGGTGQYVWALLEGWRVPPVPPHNGLRRALESMRPEALVEELRLADPESGHYIDPRNVRRVIRALEIHRTTGKALSHWRTKDPPAFEALIIGLSLPRAGLYARIDRRVDEMIDAGLLREVRELLAAGYARSLPSMSGIGYREMADHLNGDCDLHSARERTRTATHRLARHQNSWFKAQDPRIYWIEAGDGAAEDASRRAQSFLGAASTAGASS
jgi:tRNA dimethylallyltransferase